MSKVAVIGTFWTTLNQAKEDVVKKVKRFNKEFHVIEYNNGFLVVSDGQIKRLNVQVVN